MFILSCPHPQPAKLALDLMVFDHMWWYLQDISQSWDAKPCRPPRATSRYPKPWHGLVTVRENNLMYVTLNLNFVISNQGVIETWSLCKCAPGSATSSAGTGSERSWTSGVTTALHVFPSRQKVTHGTAAIFEGHHTSLHLWVAHSYRLPWF